MNRLLIFACAILITTMLIAPMLGGGDRVPVVEASEQAHSGEVERRASDAGGAMVIERDAAGQFHVNAEVGGAEVRFLVDTGADVVALTLGDAQRAGLSVDGLAFAPILRTASGVGYGARVRLDRVTVGGRELDDVEAVVVRNLPVSLLGQSALRRLGSVTLEGDRLVIAG